MNNVIPVEIIVFSVNLLVSAKNVKMTTFYMKVDVFLIAPLRIGKKIVDNPVQRATFWTKKLRHLGVCLALKTVEYVNLVKCVNSVSRCIFWLVIFKKMNNLV